jgi:hypothetical protein
MTLQTASVYSWEAHQWTVPNGLSAGHVLKLGGAERGGELGVQVNPLIRRPLRPRGPARRYNPSQGPDWASRRPPVRLRWASQGHQHVPHPPALAAAAAPQLREGQLAWRRWGLQGALGPDDDDPRQDFGGPSTALRHQ